MSNDIVHATSSVLASQQISGTLQYADEMMTRCLLVIRISTITNHVTTNKQAGLTTTTTSSVQ